MLSQTADELYEEIQIACNPSFPLQARYERLYAMLERLCAELSADFRTQYSGLFSKLYAVCKAANVDYHAADRFRRNARRVLKGEEKPSEKAFEQDVKLLTHFITELTGAQSPTPTVEALPEEIEREEKSGEKSDTSFPQEAERALIVGVNADRLTVIPSRGNGTHLIIYIEAQPELAEQAEEGMQASLIGLRRKGEHWEARIVILEPDFLIDVSTLCACVKPYGAHALHYWLSQLAPKEITQPILLGNAANRFMDDCLHESEAALSEADEKQLFLRSIRQDFHQSMLSYLGCDTTITREYFDKAENHFHNIRHTVQTTFASPEVDIDKQKVVLEPAFICPALGLRGRFDVMTTDHQRVLELKSGKADNFGNSPKIEHVLQMSLYKEMMHFCLGQPRDTVRSFLFYSAHGKLFDQRTSAQAVREILILRNEIIRHQSLMRQERWEEILPAISIDALNIHRMQGRFFDDYLKPQLQALIAPLHDMEASPHLAAYFKTFCSFLARELFLSKTSDTRPGSMRGFSRTWTAPFATKLQAGEIMHDLQIEEFISTDKGIEGLTFTFPKHYENFTPNFNEGEMVQLYCRNTDNDSVATTQLTRGTIAEMGASHLKLRLNYPQRNKHLFDVHQRYAIEKDCTDATFSLAYRGLHSLLRAPESRQQLWLNQREATHNASLNLRGDYGETMNAIVLAAKQANDFYLLVGPPGTGKTNVALRSMVQEFLLEYPHTQEKKALMLMAYTHRAVDEICGMLENLSEETTFSYIRIGNEQTCSAKFRHRLLENAASSMTNRNDVATLIAGTPIIVGSLLTLSAHTEIFRLRSFRAAIIDEASQVLEPQMLPLFCATLPQHPQTPAIEKFILIGDHKQLPAVVMQSPKHSTHLQTQEALSDIGIHDLRTSLFERLHRIFVIQSPHCIGMLSRQGRMHPDICDFVSKHFYSERLGSLSLEHQKGELSTFSIPENDIENWLSESRLLFLNCPLPTPTSHSTKSNAAEAEAVAQIVKSLVKLHGNNKSDFNAACDIGIIVPFRAQIALVRNRLRTLGIEDADKFTIDTVECYQGSQREFVVFSATISQPYQLNLLSEPHFVEGQWVDRKLNVAITRARQQFIMVGNEQLLRRSSIYNALIDASKRLS